ncbi:MAG TPA: hypothetical protein DEH78_07985, partial [Solibacterales bacterium]|nr:hypothetical protein [Bryobacterales bacterium]
LLNGVVHAERTVASETERRAWEGRVRPLEAERGEARERLKRIAEGAKAAAEAKRAEVLAGYRAAVDPRGVEERFAPVTAKFVRLTAAAGVPGGLDEFEVFGGEGRNLALASAGAKVAVSSTNRPEANPDAYSEHHLIDGKYDRRWFPAGRPAVVTVELPAEAALSRALWSSDRLGAMMQRFEIGIVREYVLEVSRDGRTWTRVASSEGRLPPRKEEQDEIVLLAALGESERAEYRRLQARALAIENELKAIGPLPAVYAGRFEAPKEPIYLLKGGNVMQRGEEVVPASLSTLEHALPGFTVAAGAPESERRLALARWIGDARNPLTPRVLANRIWHYHFGRGIVGTPSDFGFNGERPTHPELLDYLAGRLIEYGWRMKPLHKEIVMSAAYRQSSAHHDGFARIDSESRFLWRFPPQRLSAEAVRDSILAVAGKLQPDAGGPGFRLYKYTVDNVATYFPLEKFGEDTYRRAVYMQGARSIRPELLAQYDCPDSSLPEPKRVVTVSPLQALSLLNNSFVVDMSAAMAERVRREAGASLDTQVSRAFALAFVRTPTARERAAARKLLDAHGLAALCRALLNANEFIYVM